VEHKFVKFVENLHVRVNLMIVAHNQELLAISAPFQRGIAVNEANLLTGQDMIFQER